MRRIAAVLLAVLAVPAGCSRSPDAIDVDMDTSKVDRAAVDAALTAFRAACRPLFTTHAPDVRGIRAIVSEDTSTAIRRLGWGVHIDLTVDVIVRRTTLPAWATSEPVGRFLIGGGRTPGFSAVTPLSAALCDRPLPEGRTRTFVGVPEIGRHLPELKLVPNDEQRRWYAYELKRAMAGDYQGQRNIAWCYLDGCDGVEPIDDVSACAWRLVIAAAAHKEAEPSDTTNVATDCRGALLPSELTEARRRAQDLFRRIYSRDLPSGL